MRQKIVLGLGFAVCLYAVIVVAYAQQANEIGVSCAFDTTVHRTYEEYFFKDRTHEGPLPKEGDRIIEVANVPVSNWSSFLSIVSRLHIPTLFPRYQTRDRATFEDLEKLYQQQHISVVQRGPQVLVRVRFESSQANHPVPGVAWSVLGTPPVAEFVPSLLWFFVKLGLFFIGALVYWQRPLDESAYRFFLLCACTMGAFMGGYHWLRIASSPLLVLIFMICAVTLPIVSLHFYLVYPQPKTFLVQRPKLTKALMYGIPWLWLGVMIVTLLALIISHRVVKDPASVNQWSSLLLKEAYIAVGLAAFYFMGCIASLIHSLLTSLPQSKQRNQVKWILAGATLATIPIGYTLFLAVTDADKFGMGGSTWPMFFASLCITVAYGISISRYGLMEVRDVLNLSILSLGISVAAGIVYTGLVFLGMLLIESREHAPSPFWQATWVSVTAWVMLSFLHLARSRLRNILHRRLHRTKFQLDETLKRMSTAVEQQVDPQLVCRRFMHALSELVNLEQGAIFLREGDPPVYRLVAHLGAEPKVKELTPGSPLIDTLMQSPIIRARPPGSIGLDPVQRQLQQFHARTALPLRHEGVLLAVLIAGQAEHGESDIETLHLLTTFAQIAGLALHGAQGHQLFEALNRELQTKVEKISEQQRLIVTLQTQLQKQIAQAPAAAPGELVAVQASKNGVDPNPHAAGGMVGGSDAIRHLQQITRKVAASSSAVLIRGESGTGKELVARAIHELSARAKGPFVKVHCAALSPGLLESELFGHVKGAFTGAHKDKVGRFELADGGDLFLDEIGDINLDIQTKLLRVLQEMTFERVGSSAPIQVDVRIIAATHQDLERLMKEGKFREDLFYRLNVITIRTPPLRERREDLSELAMHFLAIYAHKSGKRDLTQIDDDVLAAFKAYAWPGNVRELENVIERAVVLAEGRSITMNELPEELRRGQPVVWPMPQGERTGLGEGSAMDDRPWLAQQEEMERQRLVQALAAASGNKARAARALGLPRSTFISKLEKYGLLPRRV